VGRQCYLRRALEDMGWKLSAESPSVAQHTAKALRLFIKHVLRDPNLYISFKRPKVELSKDLHTLTQ
jgi:hypothetical protein